MILLDTDVCIEILRGNRTVIENRQRYDDQVAICCMTVGELFYSAEKSNYKLDNLNLVEEFILTINVIDPDLGILIKFGELKLELFQKNMMLPDADILIAATSLMRCTKLISSNVKHFSRFENLSIENWIR